MESIVGRRGVGNAFLSGKFAGKQRSHAPVHKSFDVSDELLEGRETILLVNDLRKLRGIEVQILRGLGYKVLEASDPLKAQIAAKNSHLDLLFLDIEAPDTDWRLALWFRVTYPSIKVLLASDALWQLDFELGVSQRVAFLAKPFSQIELARVVRRVLGGGLRSSVPGCL